MNNPLDDLNYLGLGSYEISLAEGMHDIAYHIDNVLVELPNHVKPADKIKLKERLDAFNAEKEKKRCCDKRTILLRLTKDLYFEIDGNVHRLLRTLSEIQRIMYLDDDFRTPMEILRLHNACFEHFVLMKKLFRLDKLSAKMTRDKLFGKYEHNLLVHAPLQFRLISGQSANVEDEERIFNTISNSQSTTNNRPGHLIGNLVTRLQVETGCKERYEYNSNKDYTPNEIHELGVDLYSQEKNSLFTYDYIRENCSDWQSHLERISDFLSLGNVWWQKTEFGIEFFDYSNVPENRDQHPKVHHFRSSNISSITLKLKKHWDYIVDNNIFIPTHVILEGDENEKVQYRPTSFLDDQIICDHTSYPIEVSRSIDEYEEEGEEIEEEILDIHVVNDTFLIDFEKSSPDSDNIDETLLETVNVGIPKSNTEKIVYENSCSPISYKKPRVQLDSSTSVSNSTSQVLDGTSGSSTMGNFYTQEASVIYEVLGCSSLLTKYDNTKRVFKQGKSLDLFLKDLLIDIQSQLQTKVLQKVSSLKQDLNQWERSFMVNNKLSSPSISDYENDTDISNIYRKMKIGDILLKKWNIKFY